VDYRRRAVAICGPGAGSEIEGGLGLQDEVARDIAGDGVPQSHSVTEKEGRWIL
jgi:hypothetical protein